MQFCAYLSNECFYFLDFYFNYLWSRLGLVAEGSWVLDFSFFDSLRLGMLGCMEEDVPLSRLYISVYWLFLRKELGCSCLLSPRIIMYFSQNLLTKFLCCCFVFSTKTHLMIFLSLNPEFIVFFWTSDFLFKSFENVFLCRVFAFPFHVWNVFVAKVLGFLEEYGPFPLCILSTFIHGKFLWLPLFIHIRLSILPISQFGVLSVYSSQMLQIFWK